MSRSLPPHPTLEHLKKEAKEILRAHRARDASVLPTLRRLRRFDGASDAKVFGADVALHDAQFALAMDYGLQSWDELRQAVEARQSSSAKPAPVPSAGLALPDPPTAEREVNRFASAYHLLLSCCGIACDHDTVAGDSGLAFIIQADSLHPVDGAKRGDELNIGYWPVDQWGALLRLDFLGRVYGRRFQAILEREQEYGQDAAEHFRRYFQPAVVASLQEGRPVLALEHDMYVVTRMDDGRPPLLGQIACALEAHVKRLSRYPWSLVVLGEPMARMERTEADKQAVEFAVRLHQDQYGRSMPGKSTGRVSLALWSRLARDPEVCGPWFYHANVAGHLERARASAGPYLRQMAQRHGRKAADRLQAAAEVYEQIVSRLRKADVSEQTFTTSAGRDALADAVDHVAGLEAQAVTYLDQARQAM